MHDFLKQLTITLITALISLAVGFAAYQINLEQRLTRIETKLEFLINQKVYEKANNKIEIQKAKNAKRIESLLAEKVF